jgi:serine/threonine protein kinase/tetratricopeptide (TPR) repeat protein
MEPGVVVADRFHVLELAGWGGMGSVCRARDLHTGLPVALKVILRSDGWSVSRFADEARLLAELHHPAIVRYVAHGLTARSEPYLAMEWLDGEVLAHRLEAHEMSIAEAVKLGERVADALGSAHACGIVHRDIKPSNLFLVGGDVERVKVLDFGIARRLLGAGDPNENAAATTFGYMAPEQARGASDLDARADVFALGCVLYACLTRQPAFMGETPLAVLAKILMAETPRLSEHRPDVPAALENLIVRMLSKDPGARPGDGATVARELRALREHLETAIDAKASRATATTPSLTRNEQHLVCVILMSGPQIDGSDSLTVGASVDDIRHSAAAFGAELESLADGTLVVTLNASGVATDQAVRAAQCSLALRALVPERPMSLAIGRAEVAGHRPVGEAIDRAVRALKVGCERTTSRASIQPISLDHVAAGLLDVRFEVGRDGSGFELRRERVAIGFGRTLLGRQTPCVGREQELAILSSIFDECVSEPVARPVVMTGPPGVGKSRLLHEHLRRLQERQLPLEIWIGRGDPMRIASPFGILASALRKVAGVLDGEPLAVRRSKLAVRVGRNVPASQTDRVTAFIGELVGVPFPEDYYPRLATARQSHLALGDEIRRAWLDFIDAECAAQPVVLVLEDLHWADPSSIKLVDSALRNSASRPLLVLGSGRRELETQFPSLFSGNGGQHLRVLELTRAASERLAREVLGQQADADSVARLVERAAGNPFYLEELIRAAAEGAEGELPGTLLAMVQARLEGLPPDARRLLRAASVFGEAFWRGGLLDLLGGSASPVAVDEWLDHLVDREVISGRGECRFSAERDFVFRHAVVREVAYGMLTQEDRRLGHRLAGEWLERAGEQDAIVFAEHFDRGGETTRAATWYRRAAEQAMEGDDLEAVLTRASRGVTCGASGETLGVLRGLQAEAHQWRIENDEAERRGTEAMSLLARGGPAWCRAATAVALAHTRQGRLEEAEALAAELLALEHDDGGAAQITSLALMAIDLLFGGRRLIALRLLDRLQSGIAARRSPIAEGWLNEVRAKLAGMSGDAGGYLDLELAAAQSFENAGLLRYAAAALANAGDACKELGCYERAMTYLEQATTVAERTGAEYTAWGARQNLVLVLGRLGRVQQAVDLASASASFFATRGDRRCEAYCRIYAARVLGMQGEWTQAGAEAQLAADRAAKHPPLLAFSLAAVSETLLALGKPADALAAARRAYEFLISLGSVDEGESLIRIAYAEALSANGHLTEAGAATRTAAERLHARAQAIGDPELRASFLERVSENARTMALAEHWEGH